MGVQVRALEGGDREAVAQFMDQHWGPAVVAHGTVFHPAGLLTCEVRDGVLEIVTLNAVVSQPHRSGPVTVCMRCGFHRIPAAGPRAS
jgi:hypothetical protein